MNPITHAQLDWDDQGRPHSRVFDDVYFSDQSGLEETRYVFLEQNRLQQRFAALPADGRLVIGETGFGTGLNFLCAWQLFEQHAVAGAHLHFVSVEKYPLSHVDLQRALALWPELQPFAEQLLAQYIAVHQGFQRLVLDNGRVTLTLLIGDAWNNCHNWMRRSTRGFSTASPRRKTPTCGPPSCLPNWRAWRHPAQPSVPLPAPVGYDG